MGANLANDSAVGIKHSMQQNYQVQDLYRNISDIELFQEIESMWIRKGSQPITTDIKDGYSKYSLNTYTRRFGGWRNALIEFILYIEKNDTSHNESITQEQKFDQNIDTLFPGLRAEKLY